MIACGDMTIFAAQLKMSVLKPKILEWCVESWKGMVERKQMILDGWAQCCTRLFNVLDPERRCEAMAAVQNKELDDTLIPDGEEEDTKYDSDSSDDSGDERDFSIPIPEGKRTGRVRSQPEFLSPSMGKAMGIRLDPCSLAMELSDEDPDSDADGLAR
jgi:hypothetical protein